MHKGEGGMRHFPSDRIAMAAKAKTVCDWREDERWDRVFHSDCGFSIDIGDFTCVRKVDVIFDFCPRCGKRLKQKGGEG